MQRVTHISLAQRSIEVEQPALKKLEAYLQRSKKALIDNPDADEILQDIEAVSYTHLTLPTIA